MEGKKKTEGSVQGKVTTFFKFLARWPVAYHLIWTLCGDALDFKASLSFSVIG